VIAFDQLRVVWTLLDVGQTWEVEKVLEFGFLGALNKEALLCDLSGC
jgi:hypothetical protein